MKAQGKSIRNDVESYSIMRYWECVASKIRKTQFGEIGPQKQKAIMR